jgi:transposase
MGSGDVRIQDMVTKRLGSLWVVQQYLKRLGVQQIIDSACPVEAHAKLTHGQVISALVGNRLNSPTPLYQVGQWAQAYAAEEVFGTPADLLNDDRIGRALDAIYAHLETLKGSVAWRAISEFGIDASVWHWDFTSLSFHGAYEEQDAEGPQVTYGHSKARRPDLKQVMVGFGVTGDGAIPLHHDTVNGSTAEVGQVVAGLQRLKELAKRDNLIMVGDTKLISQPNIIAACRAGVQFCAPAPASDTFRKVFLSIPPEEFQPLAYSSEREERKAPEERSSFLGAERAWVVYDRKTKEAFPVRCIYVRSSEEQAACRANRARQMERAEGLLRKVENNLGTRWYDTPERVGDALKKGLQKLRMEKYYTIQVGGTDGEPTLEWKRNEEAITAAEALDGFYVLVTNLPAEKYDPSQVLQLYKRQYRVERRFGDFKGPLTVSPMFLKDNRRIAALVFVVYLALLIYCLLEREARRALTDPDKARWTPYDPYGSKRRPTHAVHDPAESGKIRWVVGGPAERPTGRNLLEKLEWLHISLIEVGGEVHLVPPKIDAPLQKLHELIGVPLPFSA